MPMTLKINNIEFRCKYLKFFEHPDRKEPDIGMFMGCVVDPSEDIIENVLKKDSMEYPLEYEYTEPFNPKITKNIKGMVTISQYHPAPDSDYLLELRISGTIKFQEITQTIKTPSIRTIGLP
jgi:hypothetical protein